MTKRLGIFLGLGFIGVVVLLTGLAWDAVAHANDPTLAGREGIFTLSNPGHVLLGLGIGLVLVSLIGGCDTLLASSSAGRWGDPRVRPAFLAVSAAVVVTAGAVTSWSAGAGHEHSAAAGHGHDQGQLAAAPDGTHPHDAGGSAAGGPVTGHDHAVTSGPTAVPGEAGPAGGAPGHDHARATTGRASSGHVPAGDGPAGTTVGHGSASGGASAHDHGAAAPGGNPTGAPATSPAGGHPHDRPPAGEATHDHGSGSGDGPTNGAGGGRSPDGGHAHDGPTSGAPTSPVPQGTWGEINVGPFVIPPESAGGGADHANIAVPSIGKPCTNCFLQQLEPDLVYADGTSANLDTGMMLHHAVFFAAGRQDATCGPEQPFPGRLGERFFASGNERTSGAFPPGFGYYVDSGNWSGIFHIMNHSTAAKTVYFRVKVRWSPAASGGILPVRPLWLDMNNCRTSEYAVPAGPSSSHWTWKSNLTGRIVATGGHVHDGGVRTTLSNSTTGEHLCTSWAGWGKKAAFKGTIESMSTCTWDRVGTVRTGETLDLESVYDAPQPLSDAMGIMMAFVYETADLAAGTPAPPDARGQHPPVESTPPPRHEH